MKLIMLSTHRLGFLVQYIVILRNNKFKERFRPNFYLHIERPRQKTFLDAVIAASSNKNYSTLTIFYNKKKHEEKHFL